MKRFQLENLELIIGRCDGDKNRGLKIESGDEKAERKKKVTSTVVFSRVYIDDISAKQSGSENGW